MTHPSFYIDSLSFNENEIHSFSTLKSVITPLGKRGFTFASEPHRIIPLKTLISKIEDKAEEIRYLTEEQKGVVIDLCATLRDKNRKAYIKLNRTPLMTRILHFIRSFFGNLGFPSHEERLEGIEREFFPNEDPDSSSSETPEWTLSSSASSSHSLDSFSDSTNDPVSYSFTPYEEKGLVKIKEHFPAFRIEQVIGAIASLLRPGYNSYEDAKLFRGTPSVALGELGLVLNFEESQEYPAELQSSLQASGLSSAQAIGNLLILPNMQDLAFFLKEICLLDGNDIGTWLIDSKLDKEFLPVVMYYLTQEMADNYAPEFISGYTLLRPSLTFAEEKQQPKFALKRAAATLSVMRPGGNILKRAEQLRQLPVAVRKIGKGTVHFLFDNAIYAQELACAFTANGFRDVWYEEVEGDGCHTHKVAFTDPKESFSLLDNYCSITRSEIEEIFNDDSIHKKIEEYYTSKESGKAAFSLHDNEIPLEKVQLTKAKLKGGGIPKVDAESARLEAEDMIAILNKMNFEDPKKPDYLDWQTLLPIGTEIEDIEQALGRLWNVAHGLEDTYGMPEDPAEKAKYRSDMKKLLQHITSRLPFAPPLNQALNLINLAIASEKCGGRFSQELILAYHNLLPYSKNPHDNTSPQTQSLNTQEARLFGQINEILARMKTEIFERILLETTDNLSGDLSHTRNFYMNKVGSRLGIPGAEMASYRDPYKRTAHIWLGVKGFERLFFEQYQPGPIIELLSKTLGYGFNESNTELRNVFIDVYTNLRKGDGDLLDYETLFPDNRRPDPKYLIQILQYLGFFQK